MNDRVQPDAYTPGAFQVVFGSTAQSYVDPSDPLRLEYEYVQRIAEVLDATALARAAEERIRVVHLGGGGLTIPRYVEARRPRTAQIVCEPDAELTQEVRRKLPLAKTSGIKVRAVGGREGIAAMPEGYADAVILDAFAEARVPAELASGEFFDEVALRLRPRGVVIANVTDRAPFYWSKRFVAALAARWSSVLVSAEPAVWKGRRFGNLVACASDATLPERELEDVARRAAFPYRVVGGRELHRWLGGADEWSDDDVTPSPEPPGGRGWYS